MKDKYRKYLLVFVIFLVVAIFVDVIFNFSGIMMNNYKETFNTLPQNAGDEIVNGTALEQAQGMLNRAPVKSIISKMHGKVINILPTNTEETPTRDFIIKINGQALSVNKDGTYGLVLSNNADIRQHWRLTLIENVILEIYYQNLVVLIMVMM